MKIHIVYYPLNHTRWTTIYLLVILLTLMFAPIGKAEITTTITRKPIVEYHWKLFENYYRYLETMELLYGKTRRETKKKKRQIITPLPDEKPPSHLAQIQKWKQRATEYAPAESAAPQRSALSVRGQNHRGGHRTSPANPPSEGQMHWQAGSLYAGGTP